MIEAALPARSVAAADGVQLSVPAPAAVVAAALWVPSVIVTAGPLWTIVDAVPVAPKVRLAEV
jgi:hypothetical protein